MAGKGETFGELLARYRNVASLSQRDVASKKHGLSYSFISMLESGQRGSKEVVLRREQVWYLVTKLKLWPPECDKLLEAAGHATDRNSDEEQEIQKDYAFRELWVFARIILDPDESWYEIVRENIVQKGVIYRYFTETPTTFHTLFRRLQRDRVPVKVLRTKLECIILPRQLFVSNFAIYKKGDNDIYCCASKPAHGKGETFYTMHPSEAHRLFEQLHEWRGIIDLQRNIPLSSAKRIYPPPERFAGFESDVRGH